MTNRPDMPSPAELWQQAGGDRDEYRRLLRERGHLVDGPPEPLPCGWTPGGKAEEPHHAAARQPTREEREAAHVAYLRRERRRVQGGSR